jgi:hypothetical protein
MALRPDVETGISTPEIKLTDQLTGDDVQRIADKTGGIIEPLSGGGSTTLLLVRYPRSRTVASFSKITVKDRTIIIPGSIKTPHGEFRLRDGVIALAEDSDSVTVFVRDPVIDGDQAPSVGITTLRNGKVSYTEEPEEEVRRDPDNEIILKALDTINQ